MGVVSQLIQPQNNQLPKLRILNGSYEVLDSGSVLLFECESPIVLVKQFSSNFTLTIKIISKQVEGAERELTVRADGNNNVIEYHCTNFNNLLGTGTVSPVEMGTIGEKGLYIHFWLYSLGDGSNDTTKKLEYTIWCES